MDKKKSGGVITCFFGKTMATVQQPLFDILLITSDIIAMFYQFHALGNSK